VFYLRIGIDASNIRAGGGITHLSEMLGAADPDAYGITEVIVWSGKATLDKLPCRPWLTLAHVPTLDRSMLYRMMWQSTALTGLASKHCDLLFSPGASYAGSFKPLVVMSQNMLPFAPAERGRYKLIRKLRFIALEQSQTRAFRRASGVVFLTAKSREMILNRIGALKVESVVIPHGVLPAFNCPPREQRAITEYSTERPFRLLYVSTVDLYKHQWHVVEAVAQLRAKGYPVTLDLIGGAYPPALEQLKSVLNRVDPQQTFIRYLGAVPYREVQAHYHNADLFIFASSCENLPNILIEAMSSGLPVTCSNRDPMPHVLGNAGSYFDPENPQQIAETIERMLLDPELRQRCANAGYQESHQYTWKRCADETFSYFARLIAAARL